MYKKISMLLALMVSLLWVGCGNKTDSKSVDGEKVYNLKLAHIMPLDHPNGLGAQHFADLVKKETNGKVVISVFPAGQLGNEKDTFDAIEMGSIDFGVLGFGEPSKRFKDFGIFDAPFLATSRDQMVKILNSDVSNKLYSSMGNKIGLRALSGFYYGARYITTSKNEIREPKDLKGLNIRVPDQKIYIDTLSSMGASATPMSFGEVFLALQQGVIDGQENPLATIASNKFNQVQKYLIKSEHIIGTQAIYMSNKSRESLPKKYVEIIDQAAKETANWTDKVAFDKEDEYLVTLQKNGMILIDDVDKASFKKSTENIYKEFTPELVSKLRAIN